MPHSDTTRNKENDNMVDARRASNSGRGGTWYAGKDARVHEPGSPERERFADLEHRAQNSSKNAQETIRRLRLQAEAYRETAAKLDAICDSLRLPEQQAQALDALAYFRAREAFPRNVIDQARSDALIRYKNIENLNGEESDIKYYKEISDDLHIIHSFAHRYSIDRHQVKEAMRRITNHDKDSWIYKSASIPAVVEVIKGNYWIQTFLHPQEQDRPSSDFFVPKKHLERLIDAVIKCKQAKARFNSHAFIKSIDPNSTKTVVVIADKDWNEYLREYEEHFKNVGPKKSYKYNKA